MKKIAIITIFILVFLNFGCLSLKEAYIPQSLLTNGWYEDFGSEEKGSGFLGIGKWSTKIYKNGDVSYLSVTSMKFLIMQSKDKLLDMVEKDIKNQAEKYGIEIIESNKTYGEREILKGHKTFFVIYEGIKGTHNYRIIGEVWSCSKSGISVICMGYSDLSEIDGIEGWHRIVADPEGSIDGIVGDGLIYNVVCH
ncbi:MAG: hypothetical protein DRN25_04610 [Thermoplasmata archaeon]|nr:MAG: hypothetical protein DRN25_04610 [Thermoplasmata archaeon]